MPREMTEAEARAYQARTDRADKLAKFVCTLVPAYGQFSREQHATSLDDEETPSPVLSARDQAVKDALDAIARIAREN